MKEICFINKGESINKIKYQYGYNESISVTLNKKFDYNYVEIGSGADDVLVVKNYLPNILYSVKKNECLLDIMARGYDIIGGVSSITEGDLLVLNKPRSLRHVVKPLETIESICLKYGVDKNFIIDCNQLSSDKLFVGQILWI